jgi:hypothetical protein
MFLFVELQSDGLALLVARQVFCMKSAVATGA